MRVLGFWFHIKGIETKPRRDREQGRRRPMKEEEKTAKRERKSREREEKFWPAKFWKRLVNQLCSEGLGSLFIDRI